jgi:hypothetical protein
MATGVLGTQYISSANTNTTLYTCAATSYAVVNLSLCNQTSAAVTVKLAVAASASPGNSEWIEFSSTIPAYAVLERTGIVVQTGKYIVVACNTANAVSANAWGIET